MFTDVSATCSLKSRSRSLPDISSL